jgi:hypothetical protein
MSLARRMRAGGLVCLGAGAGLAGADLRAVRGTDVICRSGGVIVEAGGARPRAVPVLSRYHDILLASAEFAGTALVTGGTGPGRKNITTPLARSLSGGTGLPRLEVSRLRMTWLHDCAQLPGLATFMHAAGITSIPSGSATCSPRWTRPMRPRQSRCSERRGERPGGAGGPGRPHRRLRRRAADRGAAADRVRHRQLRVRTLLAGMLLSQADHRPAHLTRVRDALTALPPADQVRLGVLEDWKTGPHQLTCRQTERTFGLVTGALAKDHPDGTPSQILARICDDLLEASIPSGYKQASSALAVDWTDVETFSRASMRLDRSRPEILTPPEHPPACCHQQTLTVPPDVAAKTRQKHDYPSKEHRRSYARRTGGERTFSTAKDPASNNIARGWCRLMGLTPLMLWLACLLAVRNQRILTAWTARLDGNARRAEAGLPPRTRRRRRKTHASVAATAAPP